MAYKPEVRAYQSSGLLQLTKTNTKKEEIKRYKYII